MQALVPVPEEHGTRAKVVAAAVDCILERGFYRATSNAIARRAGVTWGVIQHHFGTRERLMLAVLEDAARRFAEMVDSAAIEGATLDERLARYLDALTSYYGQPSYLASLQVVLNLSHDPATSADTARTLAGIEQGTTGRLQELGREVLADGDDPSLESLLFHSCRGLILSHLVLEAHPGAASRRGTRSSKTANAAMLVDALARFVESRRS